MVRAGVFIGVDKTGNLQTLHDAGFGARRMYEWALAQGMPDGTHAKLISDADGKKVHPDLIYDAIKDLIDGPGVDQLIIYFAGHGVNINRSEQWLLSDAPVKTSAAVNVSGSVDLARYCGIGHIVIISDACRVAPEGIQAQNVRGVDIFPNEGSGDKAKPVDQFFACVLGRTAAEIREPAVAASNFSALYTNALLDALKGTRSDVLESSDDATDTARYVKPAKLQDYLEREIPIRVRAMQLERKVNQNPDAILTVHRNWIARIDLQLTRGPRRVRGPRREPRPFSPPETIQRVTRQLVQSTAEDGLAGLTRGISEAKASGIQGVDPLAGTVERIATPFGPDHFETDCGIKVRGRRIVDHFTPYADAHLLGSGGDILRISGLSGPAASVLLRFEGDVGTVIPAIPGFIAAITFDDAELVDVAYEPSANTWRWPLYKERAPEVRALRALAASVSQHGRFRLDDANAMSVARQMQYAKGVDPTLAIYAAYAYRDLQAIERIREMSNYLRSDLGFTLFDIALLGRLLIDKRLDSAGYIVPFVPLLAQGWALLAANRVKLHPALDGIERTLRESLWSLFDPAGLEMLKRALQSQEVQ